MLILRTTYAAIPERLEPALAEGPAAILMLGVATRARAGAGGDAGRNRASRLFPDASRPDRVAPDPGAGRPGRAPLHRSAAQALATPAQARRSRRSPSRDAGTLPLQRQLFPRPARGVPGAVRAHPAPAPDAAPREGTRAAAARGPGRAPRPSLRGGGASPRGARPGRRLSGARATALRRHRKIFTLGHGSPSRRRAFCERRMRAPPTPDGAARIIRVQERDHGRYGSHRRRRQGVRRQGSGRCGGPRRVLAHLRRGPLPRGARVARRTSTGRPRTPCATWPTTSRITPATPTSAAAHYLRDGSRAVGTRVEENPFIALVIAGAVGYGLALLLHGRR